MLEWNLDLLF